VKVTIWGSRGSIASAGPDTVRYGGNTACVSVQADDGTVIVLDAGTGIRRLGASLPDQATVHVLLTHLHMDHIQGLGFFGPFFEGHRQIHVWGPPSTTEDLRTRLTRYLSPPLFPVRLRDLDSAVELHDVPMRSWAIGPFQVTAASVIHPGPTVGYRIAENGRAMAYLPDHEPALGGPIESAEWTSGVELARGADLLLHDSQYSPEEYQSRVGWGHSAVTESVALAELAGAARLVPFHHDPAHDDDELDALLAEAQAIARSTELVMAREGTTLAV
jgi:phosphoribosyl 1,2-cyclic phosphodiesterase